MLRGGCYRMALVILNAGHGGSDAGSIFENRFERDDNLRLTFAVGELLTSYNIDVYYLRVNDIFISPVERAKNANNVGGDLLVNIHRGSGPFPNTSSGARVFIDHKDGIEIEAAENILKKLEVIGFYNNGISVREGIYLLSNVTFPAFELIVGYINSEYDNELFDTRFYDIANAIALGILETLEPQ
jgi:N-acetylmuramoyl-L-alanine amidase